ncbi:DNA gyrase inhibitor [Methylobacterium sp. Leaf399]|uniref:DNA gyrase inhibitor YacG n=1 Tax=unclassified Methylobacterium TaxID=2615210 RepID=UPI0006FF4238|nr:MULTISPECIES: DNA gyrase inhibitor YacG [unclassified Methylobacterium]KQT09086.1 DNA gyrase inhibitor [Methylobacterium sp. Leaf399]KQT78991.1 DNA gyrase inhibitor [Methylobacterium sp. Leaf466]
MSARKAPTSDVPPCPICAKPAKAGFAPFCSARCADVDLGRWLTDRYAIPTPIDEDEDGEPPESGPRGTP